MIGLIRMAGDVLSILVIANALISWVQPDPHNPIVRFLHRVTEPLMAPIRAMLPPMGGMDFSPMVAILAIQGVEWLLISALR